MKILLLVGCLLITTQSASAALCSQAFEPGPCTPDPDKATNEAKKSIVRMITAAKAAENTVKTAEQAYRTVRADPNATLEEQLKVLEDYRHKKLAQDRLYEKALQKTAELYHVGPENKSVTIGAPFDPEIAYVEGLKVAWSPQVTDSGPGVRLAIKVIGADNKPHYSGTSSMNPLKPGGIQGLTLEDGRVLITKGMFDLAVKEGNLGILARVLSHEAKHFDNLSKPPIDSSNRRVGWDSVEEEERRAYYSDVYYAKVFGLDKATREGLQRLYDAQVAAIRSGANTSRGISPADEAGWKNHYENVQINLGEEYEKLKASVAVSRRRQAELLEAANPPKKNFWESGDPDIFQRRLAELKKLPPEAVAIQPIPPPPFSRALPRFRAFAVAACRAPEQVAIEMFLTPYYDHSYRAFDDDLAGKLASGLGECPRRLFYKMIELLRAHSWRQADRRWIRSAVAEYSRPPENPADNYAPPAGGGNGGYSGGNRSGGETASPPAPPPVSHDAEGEALEQLREIERRKRWGLRPVL